MSADEAKRLLIEETALLQIRQAGREPTEKEIERIRESAAGRVSAARAASDLSEQLQFLQDHARITGRALESGLTSWIRGTETSWKSLVASMLEDMAMLAVRKYAFEPLFGSNRPGDIGGLFGSALTSIFGGGSMGGRADSGSFGSPLGSMFGGFRAAGGDVEAGRAYIVGEKRPELFIPSQNGTILPSVPSGSTGGRIDVYVHGTPELDAQVRKHCRGCCRAPSAADQRPIRGRCGPRSQESWARHVLGKTVAGARMSHIEGADDETAGNAAYPYVRFGRKIRMPDNLLATKMARVQLSLSVFSDFRGQEQVDTILSTIEDVLDDVELVLEPGHAIRCDLERADTTLDADGVTYMGSALYAVLVLE